MSRVVNIDSLVETVAAYCAQHDIGVSTMEPLQSGGTRVVLKSAAGAATLRRKMSGKLLEGPTVRSALYAARPPIPFGSR